MKYVYILKSEVEPERFYIGSTDNLERRLQEHNTGQSVHTNKYRPWKIKTYISFNDIKQAEAFEGFLKTGNGRVFAKKRL
jgi:predicted GIY-YIG superfamily endonuclease